MWTGDVKPLGVSHYCKTQKIKKWVQGFKTLHFTNDFKNNSSTKIFVSVWKFCKSVNHIKIFSNLISGCTHCSHLTSTHRNSEAAFEKQHIHQQDVWWILMRKQYVFPCWQQRQRFVWLRSSSLFWLTKSLWVEILLFSSEERDGLHL